jgi:hypothetical protein
MVTEVPGRRSIALSDADVRQIEVADARFQRAYDWWIEHRDELTGAHPDEHVAIGEGGLVDHDPDLYALAGRLTAAGHVLPHLYIGATGTKPGPIVHW